MKAGFIESIETWNSGGHVMLDIIKLKSGNVLVISEEVVCRYDSINHFMEIEDYGVDEECIELWEEQNDKK
jgi:hypothetical protein